jgi:hypothetical protein
LPVIRAELKKLCLFCTYSDIHECIIGEMPNGRANTKLCVCYLAYNIKTLVLNSKSIVYRFMKNILYSRLPYKEKHKIIHTDLYFYLFFVWNLYCFFSVDKICLEWIMLSFRNTSSFRFITMYQHCCGTSFLQLQDKTLKMENKLFESQWMSPNLDCITSQKKEILVLKAMKMANFTYIQRVLKIGCLYIWALHSSAEFTWSESNIYCGIYHLSAFQRRLWIRELQLFKHVQKIQFYFYRFKVYWETNQQITLQR